jgi:hypothetical protein
MPTPECARASPSTRRRSGIAELGRTREDGRAHRGRRTRTPAPPFARARVRARRVGLHRRSSRPDRRASTVTESDERAVAQRGWRPRSSARAPIRAWRRREASAAPDSDGSGQATRSARNAPGESFVSIRTWPVGTSGDHRGAPSTRTGVRSTTALRRFTPSAAGVPDPVRSCRRRTTPEFTPHRCAEGAGKRDSRCSRT